MKDKIQATVKELKDMIFAEVYIDNIDSMTYHSMLTRLEYIENLVLNEELVKREHVCIHKDNCEIRTSVYQCTKHTVCFEGKHD